nr:TNF receptor-associated factor 4 isoform X8 [Kogia breviceps]
MPGFDYKFLEKPKRRLLCPLCGKPMREPVQVSTCGHRFCDTCLQEFLSEGVFKCPEDQLPLDYAKIYPDPELEVQVLGLPIRCIHSEEGCRWSGPLRHLQGHLNTCSFNVVPCPNRCPAKLSRRDLPAHLQHDCPKRRLKCEFCGCDFSGEAFESHEGVCPQESVYCENKCGARMMRRLLAQHATSECPKRTQPCTYCTKEFVFDTIQSHQYQCPRLPVPCPNQCGVGTMAREDLPGHLKDSCSTALVLCPFKDSGCKHRTEESSPTSTQPLRFKPPRGPLLMLQITPSITSTCQRSSNSKMFELPPIRGLQRMSCFHQKGKDSENKSSLRMPGSWQGVSAPFSLSLGRVSPEYTQKVLNKGLLRPSQVCETTLSR